MNMPFVCFFYFILGKQDTQDAAALLDAEEASHQQQQPPTLDRAVEGTRPHEAHA